MIHVVGGTYTEICHFPYWQQFFGSGGRAAAAIASLGGQAELSTFSSPENIEKRLALGDCFGFRLHQTLASQDVRFEYLHPLTAFSVSPSRTEIAKQQILVNAPVVLRFGLWEGTAVVQAQKAVYDPQSPGMPERFDANGSSANVLAIVCNLHEGQLLSGRHSVEDVISALQEEHGATVVVLKDGPTGAHIKEGAHPVQTIPSYRTPRVFSIGSGDVFSAAFTYYWVEQSKSAVEAAGMASKAVAMYCSTSALPSSIVLAKADLNPAPIASKRKPVIYLAGPFFSVQALWLVEEIAGIFEGMGVEVFSPYHEVGCPPSASEIATQDLNGLMNSDVVFAVLDGYDPGTVFEIGYARSHRIPVIALIQQRDGEDLKMFEGTDVSLESELSTAVYKAVWLANERAS